METSLLTARAAAGDLDSFGQLYDLYFGRVYDFTWRVLRDADAAGIITRDVFDAARAALPTMVGADFGAWALLAAARAALARAEEDASRTPRALHEEAFGSFDVPDPCRLNDPSLTGGDHALACNVWDAATTLGTLDYAALDLHLRQHIDPPALAPLLGVGKGNARVALDRLEQAADDAMLTAVLAQRGGAACEPLRRVLADAGYPPYSDDVRRAVETHAAACADCTATRVLPSRPTAILAALAPVQAPFVLKGETWRALVAAWPAAGAASAAVSAADIATRFSRHADAAPATGTHLAAGGAALALDPAFDGAGFDDGGSASAGGFGDDGRRNIIWFAAAAIGMIAVAFLIGGIAVGAFGLGSGGGDGGAAAATTRTTTPLAPGTPGETPSPGVTIDTPTPAPSPSPGPSVTDTPAPVDTPTAPPAATATRPIATATPTRVAPTRVPPTPLLATPTPRQPTPGGPPTPTPRPGQTPLVP